MAEEVVAAAPRPLPTVLARALQPFQAFFRTESSSGLLLLAATVAGLGWANSPWSAGYHRLLDQEITLMLGGHGLHWALHHFIDDALMAIFLLLVGMEIKRELVLGELNTPGKAALPLLAALGGMLVPALLFLAFNRGGAGHAGWGIPTATDIAFALGCLAVLKGRVPPALAVFLTALAIFDDLGAIVVIALFYGAKTHLTALAIAAGLTLLLGAMNIYGVRRPWPYLAVGACLWLAVLDSGVHPTIAGVVLGLTIPARPKRKKTDDLDELRRAVDEIEASGEHRGDEVLSALEDYLEDVQTPLSRLVHGLHPWVAFGIIPLFALANAGVSLDGLTPESLSSPVTLGVALGLFFGKQLGIFGATFLAVKLGVSPMPAGARWLQVYGVAVLGGIGFTMSLFIAALAFPSGGVSTDAAKVGILVGSAASALVGTLILRAAGSKATSAS